MTSHSSIKKMNLSFVSLFILIIASDNIKFVKSTFLYFSFKSDKILFFNSVIISSLLSIFAYKLAISIQITLCLFKCSKYELSFAIFSLSNKDKNHSL